MDLLMCRTGPLSAAVLEAPPRELYCRGGNCAQEDDQDGFGGFQRGVGKRDVYCDPDEGGKQQDDDEC